ncbi:hypothetical protein ABZT06_25440 [Streptomyces sp. NPDC005483]|uniref:hypothetical protein n=1 Tax=Streptomyces sp. NPDC005483 TaxID=3154882 RepID=UPI0033BED6D9
MDRRLDTYLAAVRPELRADTQVLGIHVWTTLHGQLVLWRTLLTCLGDSEDILIELEESLLRRLRSPSGAIGPACANRPEVRRVAGR